MPKFSLNRITFAIILAMLLPISVGWAADQDVFSVYPIQVEGDIYGRIVGDMTGDNLDDIVIFYSPANDLSIRFAGLCVNSGDRGFASRPDFLVRLPQTAVQVDMLDVDSDGSDEVVFLDADGAAFISYDATTGLSTPRRLIRQKTIFSMPVFYGILIEPFFVKMNELDESVAVIPTAKGYSIYIPGENGSFEILNQLSMSVFCYNPSKELKDFRSHRSSSFSTELATIRANDCNKDGYTDLYFLWNHKLCTFMQDSTGNFPTEPDVNISLYPDNIRGYMQSWLDDLNGDNRLDLVLSNTSGGITNAETKLVFYICGPDGKLSSGGEREINLSDSHCNLIVNDYNSDRQPELVIPALELGAIAATKMFLMKEADLHLLIYDLVGGIPEEEPRARKKLEFRFNFDHPQPTHEVSIDWSADYNLDNLLDLVFVDGKGNVKIYWGQHKDFLSGRPDLEISLDHPATITPVSLENDRYMDITVEHNMTGKFDRITVLKNKGRLR